MTTQHNYYINCTGYQISYRIDYKTVLLCFKALNNLASVYISEMLQYKESTGYNLGKGLDLVEPRTKLKSYGDRAFSSIAPRLWTNCYTVWSRFKKQTENVPVWNSF